MGKNVPWLRGCGYVRSSNRYKIVVRWRGWKEVRDFERLNNDASPGSESSHPRSPCQLRQKLYKVFGTRNVIIEVIYYRE